jgi:hypothetical protein
MRRAPCQQIRALRWVRKVKAGSLLDPEVAVRVANHGLGIDNPVEICCENAEREAASGRLSRSARWGWTAERS